MCNRYYLGGEHFINNLRNKKIVLYGLGISNKAVATYLDNNHIEYLICDDVTINAINDEQDLLVIKSPGISMNKPIFEKFKKNNIEVVSDLELFYRINPQINYICVTGSNGKTTTCNILNEILGEVGFIMAGNMGIPLFSVNPCLNKQLIVEASSFMLECCLTFHPHVYIITNLEPHHLDFHGSASKYYQAKLTPLKNMNEDDIVIYNDSISLFHQFSNEIKAKIFSFSFNNSSACAYLKDDSLFYKGEKILELSQLSHLNTGVVMDMLIAIIVAKVYNIDTNTIINKLISFKPLAHRYEIIYKTPSLVIINDSKGTNPFATMNAISNTINQFKDYKIILILGGKDGKEQYQGLRPYLISIKQIFLYGENHSAIIKDLRLENIDKKKMPKVDFSSNLKDVIDKVFDNLEEKSVILFSPASSSKDQFSSFEERGEVFKELVNKKIHRQT